MLPHTCRKSAPSIRVPAGGSVTDFVGTATYVCGITASSSATLLVWQATGPISFTIAGSSSGGGGGNSTIIAPLGSTTSPNAVSVVVASDQAAVAVKQATAANLNATIVGTGTLAVQNTAATPAGTNVIGHVIADTGSTTAVTSLPALPTGSNVIGHVVADTGSTTAVTQATGTNLHTVVDSGTVTAVTAISNALPAGTNVIGHVVADTGSTTAVTQATGTNLHAVLDTTSTTAVTQATAANLNATVIGSTTAGDTSTGAKYVNMAVPAATNCSAAAYTNAQLNPPNVDLIGNMCVKEAPQVGSMVTGRGTQTGTTTTSLISAVTSKVIYVTAFSCSNTGSSASDVLFQDGSGGTTLWDAIVPAGGGNNLASTMPMFKTTSGNALFFAPQTSSTTVSCNASGFSQ